MNPRALLGANNEAGFLLRFGLLMTALLVVPWLISLADLTGSYRYIAPGAAALILALTFLRRPVEALLGLALFVLFYDTLELAMGGPIKQVDELAVALIFALALVRGLRRWSSWFWWPRELALGLALALGVISSLAAGVPGTTWLPALLLLGKGLAFLYVVIWTDFRTWEVRSGMAIVLATCLAVFALGLMELFAPVAFQQLTGLQHAAARAGSPVVKSIFIHPELFGWFTTFVALFLYSQYLVVRRWYWLALALVLTIGPLLSARRRAILALLGGIGSVFLDSIRRFPGARRMAETWGPVAAGLVLIFAIFLPGLTGLYELTIEGYVPGGQVPTQPAPGASPGTTPPPAIADDDPQARTALYVGSIDIARDYFPLGGGLGRYGSWMSRVDYSPLYDEYGLSSISGLRPSNPRFATDTFWPQILGELGAIGLVAYMGFLGSLGYMLWRASGRADVGLLRLLALGAMAVFAQAIVESLASVMFHSPPRAYLLYLAVGVVASVAWRRNGSSPTVEADLRVAR